MPGEAVDSAVDGSLGPGTGRQATPSTGNPARLPGRRANQAGRGAGPTGRAAVEASNEGGDGMG